MSVLPTALSQQDSLQNCRVPFLSFGGTTRRLSVPSLSVTRHTPEQHSNASESHHSFRNCRDWPSLLPTEREDKIIALIDCHYYLPPLFGKFTSPRHKHTYSRRPSYTKHNRTRMKLTAIRSMQSLTPPSPPATETRFCNGCSLGSAFFHST